MIVSDFWTVVCDNFNYRFFTGMPVRTLNPLYNTMDKNKMLYIPACNIDSVVGLSLGMCLTGNKVCIFIDSFYINDLLCRINKTIDICSESIILVSDFNSVSNTNKYDLVLNDCDSKSLYKKLSSTNKKNKLLRLGVAEGFI